MRQLLLDHLKKYPLMQLQDCIKLLYLAAAIFSRIRRG